MSSGKKIPYQKALSLAECLVDLLKPACERIEIAGSLRRKRPEIGDIEIVCISRKTEIRDLFGNVTYGPDAIHDWASMKARLEGWEILKSGERYKQFDIGPMKLDLFITTPERWGITFALRTGDARFSKKLVTPRAQGGFLPGWMKVKDGRLFHWETMLETPEERDFFKKIGLRWIAPENRIG